MQFLVYSKYCKHCLQFIDELEKVPQIANCLTPLCIDPQHDGHGSYNLPENFIGLQNLLTDKGKELIVKVPTVVFGNGNDSDIVVLSGSDAFNWLEMNEQPQQQQQRELEGVNPNEMLSFSDSYSMLNSDSVSNQSYQFINRQFQSIPTVEEQMVDNKEQFCQEKYEELLKERERM
jgi:hypothetical protein